MVYYRLCHVYACMHGITCSNFLICIRKQSSSLIGINLFHNMGKIGSMAIPRSWRFVSMLPLLRKVLIKVKGYDRYFIGKSSQLIVCSIRFECTNIIERHFFNISSIFTINSRANASELTFISNSWEPSTKALRQSVNHRLFVEDKMWTTAEWSIWK